MSWITGAADGGAGPCHAVDPETWTTACGVFTSRLQLWPEVPFVRVGMAGAEACPSCRELTEKEHAPV